MRKLFNMLFALLLLFSCSVFAQNENPQEDLYSHEVLFTRLQTGTLPAGTPTYTYQDSLSIRMVWNVVPGTTPYEMQQNPSQYSTIVEYLPVTILNEDIDYVDINKATVFYASAKLTDGEWQAQVRNSLRTDSGDLIWSKYSDATAFIVKRSVDAPNRPVVIEIIFK